MPVTIKVNGTVNSLVHKFSNGISAATIPDVCKTPSPGGPVPIPYPNIAQSITLSDGTTTVKGDKAMAAIKGSKFALSNGDNPGVAGGVKSSTFMKEATWILYSFTVKMNKKNAARFMDKMFHNHENAANLAGEFQLPADITALIGQDMVDLLCAAMKAAREKKDAADKAKKEAEAANPKPKKPKGKRQRKPKEKGYQDYMSEELSSGSPLYTPKHPNLLVESTWRLPGYKSRFFSIVGSTTGRTAGGLELPGSIYTGLSAGRGNVGKTFRPDFTLLKAGAKGRPTLSKVETFIEIKFDGDPKLTKAQQKAQRLAKKKFVTIREGDCQPGAAT